MAQPIDYLFGLPIKYPINALYIFVFLVCKSRLQNLHSLDPTVSKPIENNIPTTGERSGT